MADQILPEITDPEIPAFCAHLPQRAAAFRIARRFMADHGLSGAGIAEQRTQGENAVRFKIDGFEGVFAGCGYAWSERQGEVAHG